jgi:putative tryptophan/tyrosine transport system substrate-binding protein
MPMRRREFIAGIGGTAALALRARAEQPVPTLAFVNARPAAASQRTVAAFRKGLGETGFVEDRNVTVEYHWLDSQFDRLPALMADIVLRRVAAIATPSNILIASTAKAATATIPIVFSWSCHELRPAGWQRHRHPIFQPGTDGKTAGTSACTGAQGHARGYSRQSRQ